MTNAEQTDIHVSERSALLERATRLLKKDSRIAAAWLHGSIGRSTHDEWSDIDLWIVVAGNQ
jgi:predicted nucleotidyltransferase